MNWRGSWREFTIIAILVGLSTSIFAETGPFHAVIWDKTNGLTDLGTFGGLESRAYDVNDYGVAVGYAQTETTARHAFVWDPINGMQDIGTLGGSYSIARAINNQGQVTGYSNNAAGQQRAFIWDSVNGMRDIGTLLEDSGTSTASDINELGQVVGSSVSSSGYVHAFVWDSNNGMTDLGYMGGLGTSYAEAINDLGQVVGRASTDTHASVAFFWDNSTGMQEIPVGGITSAGNDINNSGEVAGYRLNFSGITQGAFVWDQASNIYSNVVDPNTGNIPSYAFGMNENGAVVGRNFVWDPDTDEFMDPGRLYGGDCTLKDVNDSLVAAGYATIRNPGLLDGDYNNDKIVDLSDYTVWADNYGWTGNNGGILADGNGDGIVNLSDYTIWADNYGSTPIAAPEPATLGLLAIGSLGLFRKRR